MLGDVMPTNSATSSRTLVLDRGCLNLLGAVGMLPTMIHMNFHVYGISDAPSNPSYSVLRPASSLARGVSSVPGGDSDVPGTLCCRI
jgi:hypothetical protein